jgi:hypothetical protein
LPSPQAKKYQTQWAAQYLFAGEATRRGYLVSFTMGAAPIADLLVVSPLGIQFMVDVKGLSTPNFWLIRERASQENLYFALVHVPPPPHPVAIHVAQSGAVMERVADIREAALTKRGVWKASGSGLNWSDAKVYLDRWDVLPG